ncbi:MAG: outer membrane protein assembly factor BamD [Chlorobi bacterium]|nr:outer membrane protein assembly factor BamD [Chlorobiota bacterium]MCI0716673.1 outer membrane protein assembly factor BamD [Chlorobiota bacterium]
MNTSKYLIQIFVFTAAFYITGCSSSGPSINTDDPQKAFEIAKRKFDRGDYVDAIEDFSFMKIRFPGTEISDKVQFYLAESYFRQKEYLLSAYEYDNLLRNFPLSQLYPDAKFKLGLSYYELSPKYPLDQGYTQDALNELLVFLELYPEDKNAPEAEKKIKELRNKLAYKNFRTGEIYLKNDNNKAAALYFQSVYEDYIDSDWADDSMVGEAEALINGKKYDRAKEVLEKFYKLFPKSDQKSKADRLLSRLKEFQTSK